MTETEHDVRALTREELGQQATTLAQEIVDKVLRPHTPELRTAVVLQALISLYTTHVVTLPPNAIGSCGMALAGMAGELMQIASTSTAAPSGTSFH